MLVLSRKVGTQIVVAGNIDVNVVRISCNSVCLGITAPADVSIERREVHRSADQSDSGSIELASSVEAKNKSEKLIECRIDPEDLL
jgi:carbon storage regulator CsrA